MGRTERLVLPEDAVFLGFDSSTQSLKVTALDKNLSILAFQSVHFDSELPQYGTKDGVHRDESSPGRVTAPALMWVDALELLLAKLKESGFPFSRIKAVSGSGQQHGSVYWKDGARSRLRNLHKDVPLVEQLTGCLATPHSPVWMDSSTAKQCRELEKAVGGAEAMTALTGSRAHERFTGPQIRKLWQTEPEVYLRTERMSLVSSFMASVLLGDYASIDHSDGAGMNLMDLRLREWSGAVLDATAPGLEEKLGDLAPPQAVAGTVSKYLVDKYRFSPDCKVVHWSGDNPCSVAGLALNRPGDLGISLGTSDTVFGITADPKPGLEGHVFPNPVDPSCYMAMLCYKNGSLTREKVRNQVGGGTWEAFNQLLDDSPQFNQGQVGFFYTDPEILPALPAGTHRFVLEEGWDDDGSLLEHSKAERVEKFDDAASEVRALVEGQFLSMRAHAERIGMPTPPQRVIATGGGSANHHLLRLIANVFGCPVYTASRPDSASLGAALRAAHGWLCHERGVFVPIADMFADIASGEGSSVQCKLAADAGDKGVHEGYGRLAAKRAQIESALVSQATSSPAG